MNTRYLSNHVEIQTLKKSSVNNVVSSTKVLLTRTVSFCKETCGGYDKKLTAQYHTHWIFHKHGKIYATALQQRFLQQLYFDLTIPFVSNAYGWTVVEKRVKKSDSRRIPQQKKKKQFYPWMREWFMGFAVQWVGIAWVGYGSAKLARESELCRPRSPPRVVSIRHCVCGHIPRVPMSPARE